MYMTDFLFNTALLSRERGPFFVYIHKHITHSFISVQFKHRLFFSSYVLAVVYAYIVSTM